MSFPLPAAVLWDMDGTLIDSEPYWIAAEFELVAAHGGQWSHEQALQLVGNSLPASARVLQAAGVRAGVEEIVQFLLDHVVADVRRSVPWRPGAVDILRQLAARSVPCALVTASYRVFAQVVADAVAQAVGPDVLQVVVAGDDVEQGKPHPQCYLLAAQRLGVDPAACVAVEDSRSGIAAALASGARTLAVECLQPIEPSPGLSRASSLSVVTVEDLSRIAGGQVLELP